MFSQTIFKRIEVRLSNQTINGFISCKRAIFRHQSSYRQNVKQKPSDQGKIKLSNKQRALRYGKTPKASYIHLTVVKSGAYEEGKSVLLKTNNESYLFNCGEGSQRLLEGARSWLGGLDDIFLTHSSWENIGGLTGLMLFLGEFKLEGRNIKLHGPPNVEQLLKMTKSFSETSPVSVLTFDKREISEGSYSDSLADIEYIKIPRVTKNETVLKRVGPKMEDNSFAVAYAVRIRGECLLQHPSLEKLKAQNINMESWRSLMLYGESVTLQDGRVITREDIVDKLPDLVGPIVILECPHHDYLESLISSEQFLAMANDEKQPTVMVHMTPASILETPAYQEFMNRYKKTDHLLLNGKSKPTVNSNAVTFHHCLNYLHSGLFPELQGLKTNAQLEVPSKNRVIQGESGQTYFLYGEPSTANRQPEYDWSACSPMEKEQKVQQLLNLSLNMEKNFRRQRTHLSSITERDGKRPYPGVVFLGTGSSKPGPYRNVPGILLNLSPEKSLLLDCGESTCDQIRLLYGDGADEVFSKIRAMFISHLHMDHHMGLFGVMNARRKALQELDLPFTRLLLLCPIQYQRWLIMYSRLVENILDNVRVLGNEHGGTAESERNTILDALDMKECTPVPVNHVPFSFGVSMTHKDGWKIVYSGDTMPCRRLIEEGQGCDLLIHEATFSEELEYDALMKNHSTTNQAIQVAHDMKAKFTMLTHFSQRYNRVPVFTDKFTDDIGFSFDLMKVTLDSLHLVPKLKNVMHSFNMYSNDALYKVQKIKERRAVNLDLYEKKVWKKIYKIGTHKKSDNSDNSESLRDQNSANSDSSESSRDQNVTRNKR